MWNRLTVYLPQPQEPQTSASSSADRTKSQALTSSLCASRAWRLGEKVHPYTNPVELKTRHKPSFSNSRQKPCHRKPRSFDSDWGWRHWIIINVWCHWRVFSSPSLNNRLHIRVRRCTACSCLTIRPHMGSLSRTMTPGTMTRGVTDITRQSTVISLERSRVILPRFLLNCAENNNNKNYWPECRKCAVWTRPKEEMPWTVGWRESQAPTCVV